jgi:hypothetical protein
MAALANKTGLRFFESHTLSKLGICFIERLIMPPLVTPDDQSNEWVAKGV